MSCRMGRWGSDFSAGAEQSRAYRTVRSRAFERASWLRLCRRALSHPGEPGSDFAVGAIERLTDLIAEIEPAVKQDISEREPFAAEVILVGHLPIQPLQPVGRDHFQSRRSFRCARNSVLEELEALAEAIAVGERLADVQIDPPRPHPALGALFGGSADDRRSRIFLFQVFAYRGDLGQITAVIQLERGHLAVGIALEVLGLTVLAGAQIDFLLRHLDALLRHEHPDDTRIRPD